MAPRQAGTAAAALSRRIAVGYANLHRKSPMLEESRFHKEFPRNSGSKWLAVQR